MIFSSSETTIRKLVLAMLMVTTGLPLINKAQAQTVLDPAAAAAVAGASPVQVDNQVTPGPATPDGFSPLVFGPDRTISTLPVQGSPEARATWAGAISLKMHLHNPMPWPLTLDVTLTDAAGQQLTTRLAKFLLLIALKHSVRNYAASVETTR